MATFFDGLSTATSEIRSEAGIKNNTNILEATVKKYQLIGYGEVFSVVGTVYNVENLTNSDSDFTDSPAQDVLTQIETLIAAGHLLKREIGGNSIQRGNRDKGTEKVNEGRDMLKMIANGEMKLYKSDWSEFTTTGGGGKEAPTISTTTYDCEFSATDKH